MGFKIREIGGVMKFISEINAFEQWLETHYLSRDAQLMWYKFMTIANRSGWSEWVSVDNLRLMAATQMRREATMIKVRDELIKAGLIEYQKGKKGSPNKYRIMFFTCKNVVKSEVQSEVENVVESVVQSVDIYRDRQDKTNIRASDTEARTKEQDFEIIYGIYPKKRGKAKAYEHYLGWLKGRTVNGKKIKLDNRQMYLAVKKYVNQCQADDTDLQYYKNFDTLMGKQILDYVEVDE